MVKADIQGYLDVVDFFRDEGATDKKSAIRTSQAEKDCEVVTTHKLNALYDEEILDKWSKGDSAYPVLEKTGNRISADKAEEVVSSSFPQLLDEIMNSSEKKEAVNGQLDEKQLSEIANDIKNGELPDMVTASNDLLDAIEDSDIDVETECQRVGFRHPSNRWYLTDEYQ